MTPIQGLDLRLWRQSVNALRRNQLKASTVLFPLVFLLGCEPAGDSGPTDTGSPPPWTPTFELDVERGSCDALVDPWVGENARDAINAATAGVFDFFMPPIAALTAGRVAEEGCPTATTEGDMERLEGDCETTTGWRFAGSLETVATSTDVGAYRSYSFDAFAIEGSEPGSLVYNADGLVVSEDTDDGNILSVDVASGMYLSGAPASGSDVTGVFEGQWVAADGVIDGASYVRVLASTIGVVGDFCIESSLRPDPDCSAFRYGTMTLQGANQAVLTWPEGQCANCATVVLDGVEVGEVCE